MMDDGSSNDTYQMVISVDRSNQPPVVRTNDGATIEEGGTFVFNDLVLKVEDDYDQTYSLEYILFDQPQHGALEINGALLKSNSLSSFTQNDIANGKVNYINNGDESQTDHFTFKVYDSEGDSTDLTTVPITIMQINDPPVIDSIPHFVFNEDEPSQLLKRDLWKYYSDADNADNTLEVSLTCQNEKMKITHDDSSFTLCGTTNWFGETSLRLCVADAADSVDALLIVSVLPINDLPVFTGLGQSYTIQNGEIGILTLNDLADDIETPDSLLTWNYNATPDSLIIFYDYIDHAIVYGARGAFQGTVNMEVTVTDTDSGGTSEIVNILVTPDPTRINDLNGIPTEYEISQNYPNPFNPSTTIRYGIPSSVGTQHAVSSTNVTLKVYDVLGNLVTTLQDGPQSPGYYERTWNAADVSSGIYFYMLDADNYREIKKMILLK